MGRYQSPRHVQFSLSKASAHLLTGVFCSALLPCYTVISRTRAATSLPHKWHPTQHRRFLLARRPRPLSSSVGAHATLADWQAGPAARNPSSVTSDPQSKGQRDDVSMGLLAIGEELCPRPEIWCANRAKGSPALLFSSCCQARTGESAGTRGPRRARGTSISSISTGTAEEANSPVHPLLMLRRRPLVPCVWTSSTSTFVLSTCTGRVPKGAADSSERELCGVLSCPVASVSSRSRSIEFLCSINDSHVKHWPAATEPCLHRARTPCIIGPP
jgi:hypothetical protein